MVGLRVETFARTADFLKSELLDVPTCLVPDIRLPGMSGLDFQVYLAKANIRIPIIFMTGHGDIAMTVKAMKAGAFEFCPNRFAIKTCLMRSSSPSKRIGRGATPNEKNTKLRTNFESLSEREREVMVWVTAGLVEQADRRSTGSRGGDGEAASGQADAKDECAVSRRAGQNGRNSRNRAAKFLGLSQWMVLSTHA